MPRPGSNTPDADVELVAGPETHTDKKPLLSRSQAYSHVPQTDAQTQHDQSHIAAAAGAAPHLSRSTHPSNDPVPPSSLEGFSSSLHHVAEGLQDELQQAAHATHDYIIQHHRGITTFLVAISRVLEQTDATLLPAVYFYVGCAFAASPAQLGSITFVRLLVSAFASPLGGLLGHRLNRVRLVAVSCWYWAACTCLFAASTTTRQGMAVWALNGIGLGVMIPNAQSLVADYYDATHRGRAFGMLLAVGNLGSMLSSAYATNIGGATILGLPGWRFAFLTVAAVSAVTGGAMWVAAKDPRCSSGSWQLDEYWRQQTSSSNSSRREGGADNNMYSEGGSRANINEHASGSGSKSNSGQRRSSSSSSSRVWGWFGAVRGQLFGSGLSREVWVVLTTPSFIVVVVQGFLGSMPWAAFAFTTLYLQLQGWSDAAASGIMALFSGADAAGAFLGGVVGDWAAARYPNHGRIAACQFSVGIGVPLCLLMFQGLPLGSGPGVWALYGLLFCCMGLLISWAATACNNPIFAEIVPPHLRTLVYAFDRCLETALSAMGAPLVGVAAAALGFQGTAATQDCSSSSRSIHHQPDLIKARALGNALTLFSTIPWTLCALVYSFLHCTYPRDKRLASLAAAAAGRPADSGAALVTSSGVPVQFSALPAVEEEAVGGRAAAAEAANREPRASAAQAGLLDRVDQYISNYDSVNNVSGAQPGSGAGGAVPNRDFESVDDSSTSGWDDESVSLSGLELVDWREPAQHGANGQQGARDSAHRV